MKRLLGNRGLSAAMGLFMLAAGSGTAAAAPTGGFVPTARAQTSAVSTALATPTASPAAASAAMSPVLAAVANSSPASMLPNAVAAMPSAIAGGLPLTALVAAHTLGAPLDEESNCLATAVYFEARGESLEGQLAVARVVMNRAASSKYPATWCEVVKQPWQFSFVRNRTWPAVRDIESWNKAVAITRIAMANAAQSVPTDVLWYHADYVAPSWGRRLNRVNQIGTHIFYRA